MLFGKARNSVRPRRFVLFGEIHRNNKGKGGGEERKRERKKKLDFGLKTLRVRMHSSALRVGHPHWLLTELSITQKSFGVRMPTRTAGHPIRTQYLVDFRQNFQKSPSLMRPH